MASRTKIVQRIAELSHEDVAVRRKAALKLGEYGDRTALPDLCAALQDESWKVRRNAAIALGSFQDPAAVEALASIFIEHRRNRKYRSVRKEVLYALGQIGTEDALETIDRIWRDESADIHTEAVVALRRCGLPAVPTICRALAEGYPTLTPRTPRLWVAAEITMHSLPGSHARIQRDARDLLFALIDTHRDEVFAAILATVKLTPHDKYVCLEILRRRRHPLLLTIYFRETSAYCKQLAATAESDEVRAGAQAVIDYTTLTRGSDRPLTMQSGELLRGTQASVSATGTDELLRGSDEPEEGQDELAPEPVGLVAKAMRLFKRT